MNNNKSNDYSMAFHEWNYTFNVQKDKIRKSRVLYDKYQSVPKIKLSQNKKCKKKLAFDAKTKSLSIDSK